MSHWHRVARPELLITYFMLALGYFGATSALGATPTQQEAKVLRFDSTGKFKIVQFTDTHISGARGEEMNAQQAQEAGEQLLNDIGAILDKEKPDLVVFTGDIVYTPDMSYWPRLFKPVEDRKIPWTAVFGNHDKELSGKENKELMKLVLSYPHAVGEPGPENLGAGGNFVLPIRSAINEQTKATLYFLDSGDYTHNDALGQYAWITFDQIAWFRQQVATQSQANGGQPLPALAFFHIPLPEYNEVGQFGPVIGDRFEEPCNPKINSGFFAALLETKSVMGCFVGHDHINDTIGNVRGIALAYGRKTGWFTYHKQPSGARIIELTEGMRTFNTWITTGDGNKQFLAHWPDDLQPKPEEKK